MCEVVNIQLFDVAILEPFRSLEHLKRQMYELSTMAFEGQIPPQFGAEFGLINNAGLCCFCLLIDCCLQTLSLSLLSTIFNNNCLYDNCPSTSKYIFHIFCPYCESFSGPS